MKSTNFSLGVLLLLMSMLGAGLLQGASATGNADVEGTWSGALESRYSEVAPFTITSAINPDSRGRMIGKSRISSDCLKDIDVDLHVTVDGSNVLLAGSDQAGDTVTLHGTMDKTGTLLNVHYIINGSASGRCESDDGTGSMVKLKQ